MRWVVILPLLIAGCVSAPKVAGPPLPPNRQFAYIPPAAYMVTAPPRVYHLAWQFDYTAENNQTNIVFNVRSIANVPPASPQYEWAIVGVTNGLNWEFIPNPANRTAWFTVTASNTVTGLESGFAN